MKRGFTLAEVMITLTVIGIITAIILPVAFHSSPDENVMKFKKAHNTLYQVISELINSDKYYLDGDLGIKPDGTLINGEHTGDETYFCNSFADVLTAKSVNCGSKSSVENHNVISNAGSVVCSDWDYVGEDENKQSVKVDIYCKNLATNIGEEIKTTDGIVYYQTYSSPTFGWDEYTPKNIRLFTQNLNYIIEDDKTYQQRYNIEEVDSAYRCKKVFCIDIDGIPSTGSTNCDDKTDICPFGYGIRVDGKIIAGERALMWLEKSIQGEN